MTKTQAVKIRYEVFGPFRFDTSGENYAHRNALNMFWGECESKNGYEGLSNAVGVYVWTIKKDGKQIPWNVGLTDRQGFKKRFLQKETSFLKLLRDEKEPEVEVYLLARRSKGGKFSKLAPKSGVNSWLETMLIGSALNINPDLRNSAKTKLLQRVVVDGYLNDTRKERSKAARSFSALFKA